MGDNDDRLLSIFSLRIHYRTLQKAKDSSRTSRRWVGRSVVKLDCAASLNRKAAQTNFKAVRR